MKFFVCIVIFSNNIHIMNALPYSLNISWDNIFEVESGCDKNFADQQAIPYVTYGGLNISRLKVLLLVSKTLKM